jgi:hypothetical protein
MNRYLTSALWVLVPLAFWIGMLLRDYGLSVIPYAF